MYKTNYYKRISIKNNSKYCHKIIKYQTISSFFFHIKKFTYKSYHIEAFLFLKIFLVENTSE